MDTKQTPTSGLDPKRGDERTIMVFVRDTERDLVAAHKSQGRWQGGAFDDSPWAEGEFRCDCARARFVYSSGEYPCGSSRFLVERIVLWETGETVYQEHGRV